MSQMTQQLRGVYDQLLKLENSEWWGTTKPGDIYVEWTESAQERLQGDAERLNLPLVFLKALTEHQTSRVGMTLKKGYKEVVNEQGIVTEDSVECGRYAYHEVRILGAAQSLMLDQLSKDTEKTVLNHIVEFREEGYAPLYAHVYIDKDRMTNLGGITEMLGVGAKVVKPWDTELSWGIYEVGPVTRP